jgi:murein DD-endopeptidase MepM/ murein hydrolase activator NlpD
LVFDFLNPIAFLLPKPFQVQTRHKFSRNGFHATATIRHGLDLKAQNMTEQVSWKVRGERLRRDPEERQRLFFPQELASYLETAGFDGVKLKDGYGRTSKDFSGRRLIAVAKKARRHPDP